MSDDRILSALTRLGDEELAVGSDRAIRRRLETAWTPRSPRALPFPSVRRLAPVLATLVFVAGLGGSALGASADSPLWDTRVALEEAAVLLRVSTDDKVAYLLDLVQSRTEEAARQDAAGHPGAALKARAAVSSAVVSLGGNIPHEQVLPTAAPVKTATATPPASSPSASLSPSASSVPAAQLPASESPSPTRTPTAALPTPTRTEPPHTSTPTVRPTATSTARASVTIAGTVRDSAGASVTDACITTSPNIPTSTTQCTFKTKNGSYGFSAPAMPGQVITLYAYWMSPSGQAFSGSATSTVTAPTTVMPAISLTLRK
jgi:hypothetical protein